MPSLTLKKFDGSDAGSIELADSIFAAPQNEIVVREALNAFRTNQRQGTHSTKTRHFTRGGGRKPWKQKGTGRARQGSIRAVQWVGGAIAHGPLPKDYYEKLNKKKRRQAINSVLSARNAEGNLHVVESIELGDKPKTKNMVAFLEKFEADACRALIVTDEPHDVLLLSARNIPFVDVIVANEINVYSLLVADKVIFTKAAVEKLQEAAQ